MNRDTPNVPDDEDVKAAEEAEAFTRPPIGAVIPIRDPEDEPFVFRFEVGPAILIQLIEKLRGLELRPISECLGARYPGFYQIFLDGEPRYIGKAARPIGVRLSEHIKKLRGRISLDRIGCRYAYVEDPSLVDVAEGALINFFASFDAADWNMSGFGSKPTGYGRGRQTHADWDTEFPPDYDWPIKAGAPLPITLGRLVMVVASQSPIVFSIPKRHKASFKAEHATFLNVPITERTFRQWITFIEGQLAPGWTIEREARGWYIVHK